MKTTKLTYALLAFLCVGCQKVLEVDMPQERQMVLNAIPSAGSRPFVNFAYTRYFLDPSNDQPVPGATPVMTINGVPYSPDSVSHCNYFFRSGYALQPLDQLSVDFAAGDSLIHAHTYIPRRPSVGNMRVSNVGDRTFRYVGLEFDVDDSAGYREYYYMAITRRDSGMRYNEWTRQYDTVDTVRSCMFMAPTPAITDPEVCAYRPSFNYFYNRLLFKDSLVDGQRYPVTLLVLTTIDTNEVSDAEHRFLHQYTLSVQSVTPERWNYIVSSARQSSTSSFFAEQGSVWSNVRGALGIFAGQSGWKYTFDADTITAAP